MFSKTAGAVLVASGVSVSAAPKTFDINLDSLTHPPLWEPLLEEYFPQQRGGDKDEHGLASPVVLTNPTREEFVYHARKGYPILVTDWGSHMTYNGWTGKSFADKFPFGWMKAEYITHMPGFNQKDHEIRIMDGEQRFKLGSFKPDKKTMWHNFTRPASKRYTDDPSKPISGPYVWHVKDELTPKEKTLVQNRFEAPRFLDDKLNRDHMNRTFEVWFSPGSGSGAGAHNDGYCQSVVSLQLRGDKKWRMQLEPEMTFLSSYDEFDGGVYEAGLWKPDIGFVNGQAGAMVWPPGYLHETKTMQPADGECGSAITLQFAFPQPVQFLRAFLPRLSLSAEVGGCLNRDWSIYPTLSVQGIKPVAAEKDMKVQLEKILKAVDRNSDEKVTVDEVKAFFQTSQSTASQEARQFEQKHQVLFYQYKAEDTVAYHDMNDDMEVSKQELWDSLVQWNVVRIRIKEGLKLANKADKDGLTAYEKSLDYLRREPAKFNVKLRPELQELFSLPKGTKLFPSLRGIDSFSDGEWFSPARDRIEQLREEL